MRTQVRRFGLMLGWALIAVGPLRAEVVARHGDCWLEKVQEQQVLHLKGSYREMGLAHGKLLATAIAEDAEAFLDHWCVGGGKESLENLRKIYRTLEPFLPQRYKDELAGLAEGSGVPLERLQLLHAIPERFHCSGAAAMGKATKDGKLYHTRSLDYVINAGKTKRPQENALLIVYQPDDGHAYCTVSWAGFLGCVSGMNAKGISIGEMGSSSKDEDYAGIPMIFLLREALRQGGTLEETLAVFRKGPRTCGYNFLIGDGKIPDARAIEVTKHQMAEFGPGDTKENVGPHWCVADCVRRVNHFVAEETARTQRPVYDPRDANPASWVGYDLIGQWLKDRHGKIDAQAMIQLQRMYPPNHPCLHQVVFCPTDLVLWVAHAADPAKVPNAGAQNRPFYRYDLKQLLAGQPAAEALAIDYKEKPRAEPAEVVKGTVAFRPVGDEQQVPERYRLEAHEFPFEMQLQHDYENQGYEVHALRFPSAVKTPYPENNTVHCEYYRPKGKGPFPAIVVLDILGGDQTLARLQSTLMAQNGIACLFVQMAYYGPRRPANNPYARLISPSIDHSLNAVKQTVLDVRRAGAWLAARPEADGDRLGLLGTSLGSFMGGLSAEMDHRFKRVALLLGGGGLIDAFYDHPMAEPLRKVYENVLGGSREQMAARLACVDPITCATNLKDRRVLMLGAKRDDVVPPKATVALWEALGKPKIVWFDCTHTGAIKYIVPAMKHVMDHFTAP